MSQVRQLVESVPAALEYKPAAQGVQPSALVYWPAEQASEHAVAPFDEYVSGAQGVHEAEPVLLANVPAAQVRQTDAPVLEYWPAAQTPLTAVKPRASQ